MFLTVAALTALFASLPVVTRGALALAFFVGMGAVFGDALLPQERQFWRAYFGTLGVIAVTIVAGSVLYFVTNIGTAITALLIVFVATGTSVYAARSAPSSIARNSEATPLTLARIIKTVGGLIAIGIALTTTAYAVTILNSAATDGSIRSPWDVVPRMFFVLFFLAVLACIVAAHGNLTARLSLIPTAVLIALAVSVATLVYKVGFGFDPFIHRATEQVIFNQGMISPKPLYYLGHYVLVVVVSRLLGGFVPHVDASIVPFTLALVVPCAYYALRKTFNVSRSAAAAATILLLAFPLSAFVAPTPQGFADALFLLTVFCALPAATGVFPRHLVLLLTLATIAVHPLAGIPLLLFTAILFFLSSTQAARGIKSFARIFAAIVIGLLGAFALPAMFLFNSWISHANVAIDKDALNTPNAAIQALVSHTVITRHFIAVYDFVYAWKSVRSVAILLIAAAGFVLLRRKTKVGTAFLFGAFIIFANFVLMRSVIRFPFLIDYERANYADRLFELLLFLAAPLALAAAAAAFDRLSRDRAPLRIGATVLVAMVATASLYLDYPRRDKYESSRGWSTSGYDVRAVQLIDQDAAGSPYIVLANQSTSAAAVREFGFKKYFSSQIFYYPIPTGGPLYEKFLAMNAAFGTRAAAKEAMDLTGADTVYYVVTYYWWDAKRIILTAKKESDRWWSVDDKNFVFKYVKK